MGEVSESVNLIGMGSNALQLGETNLSTYYIMTCVYI